MVDRRLTKQRKEILTYLQSVKTHPTAETVYNAVKNAISSLTLATTYRNLNILVEQGLALKFEVNNEARFDGCACNHIHLLCGKCKEIFDVEDPDLISLIRNKFTKKSFNPGCIHVLINGTCDSCK